MKTVLRKVLSVFCVVAVMLSVGVVSFSFDTGATYNDSNTITSWETVVETLTMTGDKGVTGAQGGGSYAVDPRDEGHGAVYKLKATSSPSFQVGRDKEATTENTHAYNLEAGVSYRLTFDFMWEAGSIAASTNSSGTLGIGLVWGSLLKGTDSSLDTSVATRKKFKNTVASVSLDTTNATLGTEATSGHETLTLNENSEWTKASVEFATSGDYWNDAYKYLMIQAECDNSPYNYAIVNNATLYVDNIKLEKKTTVSASNKMQVAWQNAVETLNMEDEAGVTGNQTGVGSYVDDPNNAGHGKVYTFTATSSDSLQVGSSNSASATDTDAFRMDGGVTYKISFDYMWGAGSTSAEESGEYSHYLNLVWGTNLMFGTGTRAVFASKITPGYVLDDTNSTESTTSSGTAIRVQTENSPWYSCEYTFTTSTDYSDTWRDDLTSLMIQNQCNGDGNKATLYIDNIRVDRAVAVTATAAQALLGEINNDGNVNSSDAVSLLYNIMFPELSELPVNVLCDYNNDDVVDSSDAIYLLYNVMFGGDQYPIKGKFSSGNVITPVVNYLDTDNNPVYRILYPNSGSMNESNLATTVKDGLKNKLGVTFEKVLQFQTSLSSTNDYFEILIGGTKNTESAQALEYLTASGAGRKDDFVICTINNKIVINAYNSTALANACTYFIDNLVHKSGMPGGVNYIYTNSAGYIDGKINGVSVSKFQIVNARFATSYITRNEIKALVQNISDTTGYTVNSYDDTAAESAYEIIVGATERDGSSETLAVNKYSIKIRGKKVYLNGGSAHTVAMAVSEFSRMLSDGNVNNGDSVVGTYKNAVANYDLSEKYTLTWGDDFEYVSDGLNGINTDKWRVYRLGEDTNEGYDGRRAVRGDTPDVIQVKDGLLQIRAKYDENYYYGAKITTQNTMAFKYGYAEIKMRMPRGVGYWIAFWTGRTTMADSSLNSPYGPEIDIIEMNDPEANYAAPNYHGWGNTDWPEQYDTALQSTVKWTSDISSGNYSHWTFKQYVSVYHPDYNSTTQEGSFHDEMHTFGYLVTPEKVAFTMDGEEYLTILEGDEYYSQLLTDTQNCYQFLRVSQATCFSDFGNKQEDDDPDWTNGNNAFDVDYVHVYQLKDGVQKLHVGAGSPTEW